MRMRIAAVIMETGLLIFCACADNRVYCLSFKWVDQGAVNYSAYTHLYSLPLEPIRCPDNWGSTVLLMIDKIMPQYMQGHMQAQYTPWYNHI